MRAGLPTSPEVAVALAAAAAAVVYDSGATAASPKRVAGLLLGIVLLGLSMAVREAGARKGRDAALSPTEGPRAAEGGASPQPLPMATVSFAAFAAWSAISLLYGAPSGAGDLSTFVAGLALALAAQRWPLPRVRATAEWAGILAGTCASILATTAWLRGARGIFVHGGQGNGNWLGLLLAMTIPLSVGWIFLRRTRAERRIGWVLALLQIFALYLSHSRVAWVACAVSATAAGSHTLRLHRLNVLGLPFGKTRWARWAPVLVLALALIVGFRLSATHGSAPPPASPGEDVPAQLALEGRVRIWRSSLVAAQRALPLGAGLGRFSHAYLAAQGEGLAVLPPKIASRNFLNATTAHSDYLQPFVESGLLGGLLFVAMVIAAILGTAQAKWLSGFSAITAFSVTAIGDSPFRQPGIVILVGLVLVGSAADRMEPEGRSAQQRGPREPWHLARARFWRGAAVRATVLAACTVLLAVSVRTWLGERRLFAARNRTPEEQQSLLRAAARIDPTSGEIALERGLRELDLGHASLGLAELERSRRLLANVGTEVAIGNAAMALNRPSDAADAYRRALAANPGSFRAHPTLSQALLALGDLEGASRHLATAKELWPGHPRLEEMSERVARARFDAAVEGAGSGALVDR